MCSAILVLPSFPSPSYPHTSPSCTESFSSPLMLNNAMEKPAAALEHSVSTSELEHQGLARGRIRYAPDVDGHLRSSSRRSRSRDSLSIGPARRSIDPALVLPPQFRTLSFGIEDQKRQIFAKGEKRQKENAKPTEIGFEDIDYHKASPEELFARFSTSRATGLSTEQASQQLKAVRSQCAIPAAVTMAA